MRRQQYCIVFVASDTTEQLLHVNRHGPSTASRPSSHPRNRVCSDACRSASFSQRTESGRTGRENLRTRRKSYERALYSTARCVGIASCTTPGMTCPMTCPKNLRNGPCGGVRLNGNCEIEPDMRCVWVEAWERSQRMPQFGAGIHEVLTPTDRRLEGTSSWINDISSSVNKRPAGWTE